MNEINTSRLHFIDNLRAFTMLAVLFMHAMLSFVSPHFYAWPVHDVEHFKLLNALVLTLHNITMPLFFFIAGMVASRLFYRHGWRYFIWQRWRRIGIPLLIGFLLITYWHAVEWFAYIGAQCNSSTFNKTPLTAAAFFNNTDGLWFLYFLIIYYVLALLCKAALYFKTHHQEAEQNHWLAKINSTVQWIAVTLFFILIAIFILWPLPTKHVRISLGFIPDVWLLLYYGLFFGFGWKLWETPMVLNKFTQKNGLYWLIATTSLLLYLLLLNTKAMFFARHEILIKILILSMQSLGIWTFLYACCGFCLSYLNKPIALLRYLADASYWIYLIQIPIIIYLQNYFAKSTLLAPMKIAIIASSALLVMLALYQILVRSTLIGQMLNGKSSK